MMAMGCDASAGGDDEIPKKKADPVNAEINGREVDFKNISIEEALQILEVGNPLPAVLLSAHQACMMSAR